MRSTELAITGANPLTAGVGCWRVVPVERDRKRERDIRYCIYVREREPGERERQPVRER
jgi:hypothetical protein